MKLMIKLGLLFVCLTVFYETAGQTGCDFTVTVTEVAVSDCESNGVIKVTLTGANVANGVIQLSDAEYSIESVPAGGYSTVFDNNGGIIQGVPPGNYIIRARAFCTQTNNREIHASALITMIGTYPKFDQNQIMIVTGDIKKSLECSSTGTIPVKLGSGKTPYYVRIVEAPDSTLIDSVFTRATAGVLEITDIPWGDYKLEVYDACGYTIYFTPTVGKVVPEYE
ncbi:MAG: hypothetical protein LBQ70_02275, partial [Prevotellaceae bacterium]|nr:hypothetical protein [Prevotellaceae bacterium]